MSATIDIPVRLEAGGKTGQATLQVCTFTRQQAIATGLKWGAACWGLALVALPIPIVHFIAVPAALLMGPPLAFMMFKMHDGARDIVAASLTCPACGSLVPFRKRPERWPQTEPCPSCQAPIGIAPLKS
jgi:hypothetical protein